MTILDSVVLRSDKEVEGVFYFLIKIALDKRGTFHLPFDHEETFHFG